MENLPLSHSSAFPALSAQLSASRLPKPPGMLAPLPPLLSEPTWEVKQITTLEQLKRLSARLALVKEFSLDTETFGFPGEPLDEHLALIQIGIPQSGRNKKSCGGTVYIIDVLKLQAQAEKSAAKSGRAANPLEALRAALQSKRITKIIQHAQFEREQFDKHSAICLAGVLDVEVLAKKLRPSLVGRSLGALAAEILGYSLDKDEQTSDWGKRPLSKRQMDYAALDAQVTYELRQKLEALAQACAVSPRRKAALMLAEMVDLIEARQRLFRGIGNACGVLALRAARKKEELKELVFALCLAGAKKVAFRDPFLGAVCAKYPAKFSLKRLKKMFPAEFPGLLQERVSQRALRAGLTRLGLAPAEIKAALASIFSAEIKTRPALKLSLDLSRMYRGLDSGLVPLSCCWQMVEANSPVLHQKLLAGLKKAKLIILSAQKSGVKNVMPRIEIGIPSSGKKGGLCYIVDPKLYSLSKEQAADLLNALQKTMQDGACRMLTFGQAELKRTLLSCKLDAAAALDVQALAKLLRPDLAAHSLSICAAEILALSLPDNEPACRMQVIYALYQELSALDSLARPELYTSQVLEKGAVDVKAWLNGEEEQRSRVDKIFGVFLKGILEDTAQYLAALRAIGNEYDALGVRIENLKDALKQGLIRSKKNLIESPHGSAALQERLRKKADLDALKKGFPQIAGQVITRSVNRPALNRLLSGMDSRSKAALLKHLRLSDRSKPQSIKIRPRYKSIYEDWGTLPHGRTGE